MSKYLLGESDAETQRLKAQAAALPAIERIKWGGLLPGMRVVDAGCGPGEIAREMARLAGPQGHVDAFDISPARLAAGRARPPDPDSAPIRFLEGDLYAPPVEPGAADFLWCQFVFEYLREPMRALEALIRAVKPGGTICLCDADDIGDINWPIPTEVNSGLRRLLAAATEASGFDPYAGRKLYTWMVDAGLRDVRVQIDTMVTAGAASAEEVANWTQRFASQAALAEKAFGSSTAYDAFVVGFLQMLADPRSLKFTNIVTASGKRA